MDVAVVMVPSLGLFYVLPMRASRFTV
jgi:hypothetical protein